MQNFVWKCHYKAIRVNWNLQLGCFQPCESIESISWVVGIFWIEHNWFRHKSMATVPKCNLRILTFDIANPNSTTVNMGALFNTLQIEDLSIGGNVDIRKGRGTFVSNNPCLILLRIALIQINHELPQEGIANEWPTLSHFGLRLLIIFLPSFQPKGLNMPREPTPFHALLETPRPKLLDLNNVFTQLVKRFPQASINVWRKEWTNLRIPRRIEMFHVFSPKLPVGVIGVNWINYIANTIQSQYGKSTTHITRPATFQLHLWKLILMKSLKVLELHIMETELENAFWPKTYTFSNQPNYRKWWIDFYGTSSIYNLLLLIYNIFRNF